MARPRACWFSAAWLAIACTAAAAQPSVVAIEADRTAFRVTLSDGSTKQGTALAGAVLVFRIKGASLRVRLATITPDAADKSGTVLLHDFRNDETGAPLCEPDPEGRMLGFPLAGRSAPDGRLVEAERGAFELVCTSGAQGKCVRFGYRPWETASDGGPMHAYFNACVRMVRADYCGDGSGWTRDGALIDVWDRIGLQSSESRDDPAFSFEAGWSADGAVCVAHTRAPENITLDRLRSQCPRLAAKLSCDEDSARESGALLFNRSKPNKP